MDNDTQPPQDFNNIAPPEAPQPGQQFKPDVPAQKPKKSKKKVVLITLLILLLLVGGAAAAYFLYFKKDTQTTSTEQSTQQPQTTQIGPQSIIVNEDNTATSLELTTKSLIKDASTTFKSENYSQATMTSTIHEENIAFVAAPKEKQTKYAIFYSNDSGASFTNVFETKGSTSENQIGDQITSIAFTKDGASLLLGYLPTPNSKNTVIQINLSDKTTKELFSIEDPGMFLKGGDQTRIIYTKSRCFNCGGEPPNAIYSYNLSTNKAEAIATTPLGLYIAGIAVNKDMDELSYYEASGVEGEAGITAGGPYTIKRLNLSTNQSKTGTTFGQTGQDIFADLGYMADGKTLFYADNKTVYAVSETETSELFTTSNTLYEVHYVSVDAVYVSTGNYESFKVSKFDTKTKQLSDILEGSIKTSVIGIPFKL